VSDLFDDSALERLAQSNHAYYSTHGDYVPPLARLLLEARAEIGWLREALDWIEAEPEDPAKVQALARAALAGWRGEA
jgi:hypothetical protein